MSWMSRNRVRTGLEYLLLFGLTLFCLLTIFPISGKFLNNVVYAFVIFPSLILVVGWYSNLSLVFSRAKPFVVFIFAVVVADFFVGRTDFLKSSVLVFLFCSGILVLAEKQKKALVWSYLGFSTGIFVALLAAICGWVFDAIKNDIFVRQVGFGTAVNPIYAGLLSVSGLVFVWMFFLDCVAAANYRKSCLGMVLIVTLVIASIIVFEARSALAGFILFIVFYSAWKSRILWVLSFSLIAIMLILWSGAHDSLLARGLSHRPEIWLDALNQFNRDCNLLAGCGKTKELFVGEYSGAHSGYVGTLYRHGLLGLLGLSVFIVWYFYNGWKSGSRWFFVSLVGLGGMLSAMDGFIGSPHAWWVFVWLPTLAAIGEFGEKKSRDDVK